MNIYIAGPLFCDGERRFNGERRQGDRPNYRREGGNR